MVEEAPEAVVGAGLEFLASGRVGHRFGERVFRDAEGEARPGAADGGDTAGFVFVALDGSDLGGGSGGEEGGVARDGRLWSLGTEVGGLESGREEERGEER